MSVSPDEIRITCLSPFSVCFVCHQQDSSIKTTQLLVSFLYVPLKCYSGLQPSTKIKLFMSGKPEGSVVYASTIYTYRIYMQAFISSGPFWYIKVSNINICLLLKSLMRPIPLPYMVGEILFGVSHISRITAIKNCLTTDKCSEYFLEWTSSSIYFW